MHHHADVARIPACGRRSHSRAAACSLPASVGARRPGCPHIRAVQRYFASSTCQFRCTSLLLLLLYKLVFAIIQIQTSCVPRCAPQRGHTQTLNDGHVPPKRPPRSQSSVRYESAHCARGLQGSSGARAGVFETPAVIPSPSFKR
jgi:hypothetical protein